MNSVDTFWLSKNPMLRSVRRYISIYPSLYIPLRRLRMADTVVDDQTDLLIEGFPRSGNTWTEALLREASGDRLRLAHHAHAAAHVKKAMALKVPSMILFRDPDDAVVSQLTLYENQLDARGAYREYNRFYQAVRPLHGPLVRMYSFEDVTQRAADVVTDLITHFKLSASADGLETEAGQKRVFAVMDEKAQRLKRRRTHHSKSRPDLEENGQEERRAHARNLILAPKAAADRAYARAVYDSMTSDLPKPEVRE